MTAVLLLVAVQQFNVDDITQRGFRDATFTAVVKSSNQAELKKINQDFAAAQRFGTTKALLKDPHMLKLISTVDDTDVVFLLVGTRQTYSIPKVKLRRSEDLAKAPGRRQTPLDFGFITPGLFNDLFEAKFVRVDRETDNLVFDLTYLKKFDDTSKQRVFVDKAKKFVEKRVWYNQEGRLMATFVYAKPKLENGVWFPTMCTIRNADDKVAGVTEYISTKINSGLADSVFKI